MTDLLTFSCNNSPDVPILTILESTCHPQNPFHNTHLRNGALESTLWSKPAQKLLFRNVTLRNHHAYLAFHSLSNSTTLASSVHRIRVVFDHNQPCAISQHSFALAVTLCPNLYHLDLSLFGRAKPGKDIVGLPDLHRMRRPAPSFDHITLSFLKSGPKSPPCISVIGQRTVIPSINYSTCDIL